LSFHIFCHCWCCPCVFLLLTKHKSSSNHNLTSIWIFTRDFKIWEHLLCQCPILECPFRTLA
jgi:hypothetical protein